MTPPLRLPTVNEWNISKTPLKTRLESPPAGGRWNRRGAINTQMGVFGFTAHTHTHTRRLSLFRPLFCFVFLPHLYFLNKRWKRQMCISRLRRRRTKWCEHSEVRHLQTWRGSSQSSFTSSNDGSGSRQMTPLCLKIITPINLGKDVSGGIEAKKVESKSSHE